ncbi:MAG: hypothetical protein EB130_06775, partial [Actinobacteria bacterium]|nr:hypothetical protein [Actinomycetota bacterium]
ATHWISFDLHVLSTPPAFVLSQDQTLRQKRLALLTSHFRVTRCRRGKFFEGLMPVFQVRTCPHRTCPDRSDAHLIWLLLCVSVTAEVTPTN